MLKWANFLNSFSIVRYVNVSFLLVGWILIDRRGKHFGTLLNFLRDGNVPLPETKRELVELQTEAKYYLIQVCFINFLTQLFHV